MEHIIDADKLIAEIDYRLHCNGAFDEVGDYQWHYDQGMVDAYKYIREVVTSLRQEQPEVDLEKEIERFYGMYRDVEGEYRDLEDNMIVCPWYEGENQLWIKDFASYFYELGLKAKGGMKKYEK